ncbi:hypothetical protein VKT23_014921 [Stygiomarasmius scandens]|uniref:Uncharacterized protein n=1 Tax=Marasmiellus scandens TaxID=2682957 RepID=A0ABR1IR97_9AGAR
MGLVTNPSSAIRPKIGKKAFGAPRANHGIYKQTSVTGTSSLSVFPPHHVPRVGDAGGAGISDSSAVATNPRAGWRSSLDVIRIWITLGTPGASLAYACEVRV